MNASLSKTKKKCGTKSQAATSKAGFPDPAFTGASLRTHLQIYLLRYVCLNAYCNFLFSVKFSLTLA